MLGDPEVMGLQSPAHLLRGDTIETGKVGTSTQHSDACGGCNHQLPIVRQPKYTAVTLAIEADTNTIVDTH
jgi:hypothetical protein